MAPISELLLPPVELAGCVFAGIYRDTRGARLGCADRVNHFPASPLVAVSYVMAGELRLIPGGAEWRAAEAVAPIPAVHVVGPQGRPVSSWSPGPVAALTVGIYPDAWRLLGGDGAFGRVPEVLRMDPGEGWAGVCARLIPVWAAVRPAGWKPARDLGDWVRGAVARAALSGPGQSLRSLERRLKRSSGQTRGTLAFFEHFERLHALSLRSPDVPLAELAVEAGYADQSHMGRAVRRATAMSPARLNRAIAEEEPFWCYRLLGERF